MKNNGLQPDDDTDTLVVEIATRPERVVKQAEGSAREVACWPLVLTKIDDR